MAEPGGSEVGTEEQQIEEQSARAPSSLLEGPPMRAINEWDSLGEEIPEDLVLEGYGDHETYEEAVVAYVEVLRQRNLMPTWPFFLKICGPLADMYDDAPARTPSGPFVQSIGLMR